jgi:hypothetical protein
MLHAVAVSFGKAQVRALSSSGLLFAIKNTVRGGRFLI